MSDESNTNTTTSSPVGAQIPTTAGDRKSIRDSIFLNAKPKTKILEFFGTSIELRQPPMKAVMELQAHEDRTRAAAEMIVRYAYVPGTSEQVFDSADVDTIMSLPFGGDLSRINTAIAELTDIDVLGEEGNSKDTPDN